MSQSKKEIDKVAPVTKVSSEMLEELYRNIAKRAKEKERQEIIETLENFMAPLADTKEENLVLFFNGIYEAIELIKNKDNYDFASTKDEAN